MEHTITDPDIVLSSAPDLASLRAQRDEAAANLALLSEAYDAKRADLTQAILDLEARWQADNAEIVTLCDRAKEIAENLDRDLRAAVVNQFIVTGEKQVDRALKLSVRVNRKLAIADQKAALAWAKQAAPMLVREAVDEKAFVKIADTIWNDAELPAWVTVDVKPIAVIGEL